MKRLDPLCGCIAMALLLAVGVAHAVDGAIEINQASALAGGVSPGDTAGFPVTLSESGSYILTGNLALADENSFGIWIYAPHVTIDLGGFRIFGPTTCTGPHPMVCTPTGVGIAVISSEDNVTVRNGAVSGTGSDGIRLLGNYGRVERVSVHNVGAYGIRTAGVGNQVRDCQVRRAALGGILAGAGTLATGNVVVNNGGNGLTVNEHSIASQNVADNSSRAGILVDRGSLVLGNMIRGNSQFGIDFVAAGGYGENVMTGPPGVPVNGSGVQIGINVCAGNTTCP